MPEAQCIKYPIKPGHRESLVEWIARLEDRSRELLEAMSEGGFVAEAVFLETSDGDDYLLVYTSAEDLESAMAALSDSELPVIQEFDRLMAESVDMEHAVTLELVYHTP